MNELRLSPAQVESYNELGYIVLESAVPQELLARIRQETDDVVAKAGDVDANDDVYDLEASHTRDNPRVRRIKEPRHLMPAVNELVRSPVVGAIVAQLFGTGVRLQNTKMNMKFAEYGAPVEWHQDWTFYPHTNDDLLAMGLYLDDCDADNGPLMVIPGSHRGTVFNHHVDGRFCGAMNPDECDLDYASAHELTGPAGSLTFHHVRAVHGSRTNVSDRPRRLLLAQYTAVDAWPLVKVPTDIHQYDSEIIYGEPTVKPRLADVPVILPLPPATFDGSIYENQRTLGNRYFGEHAGVADAAE